MRRTSDGFIMPKDQVVSWRFLSFRAQRSKSPDISLPGRRYSFFWGRNALYHALLGLGILPGDSVLLPAYLCAAPIEAVQAFGIEVEFYEILPDCTPDFDDLETKIDKRTRAILGVHYFGFPQRIRRLRQICDARRLFLLEDCAHVLTGEAEGRAMGAWGDASFFSWRKCLPTFDGADLILNAGERGLRMEWSKVSGLFTLKALKSLLDRRFDARPGLLSKTTRKMLGALKGLTLRSVQGAAGESEVLKVHNEDATFDPALLRFPMTRVSRWVRDHSAIEEIVNERRRNYLRLQELLSHVEGIRFLHASLPDAVCPWVLPVIFEGRSDTCLRLRSLGIPATTWGGVRPRNVGAAIFPSADRLYEQIVFLPVHQDLGEADLRVILRAVKTALPLEAQGRVEERRHSG